MIKGPVRGVLSGVISGVIRGGGGGELPYLASINYYPNVGSGTGSTVPPDSPPPPMAPFAINRIHVVGDSIADLSFKSPIYVRRALKGYIDLVHGKTVDVTSSAVSGERTDQMIAHLGADIVSFAGDPDVVILNQIGMNDYLQSGVPWDTLSVPVQDAFKADTTTASTIISNNGNRQIMAPITVRATMIDAAPEPKSVELDATYPFNTDYKQLEMQVVHPQYFYTDGAPMIDAYNWSRNGYQTLYPPTDAIHHGSNGRWAYALAMTSAVMNMSDAVDPSRVVPRDFNDTPASPAQAIDIVCSLGVSATSAANINFINRASGEGYAYETALINADGSPATGISLYAWSSGTTATGRGNAGNTDNTLDNDVLRQESWVSDTFNGCAVYLAFEGLEPGTTHEVSWCGSETSGVQLDQLVGLGDGVATGGDLSNNKVVDAAAAGIIQATGNILTDSYGRACITVYEGNASNLAFVSGVRLRSI